MLLGVHLSSAGVPGDMRQGTLKVTGTCPFDVLWLQHEPLVGAASFMRPAPPAPSHTSERCPKPAATPPTWAPSPAHLGFQQSDFIGQPR